MPKHLHTDGCYVKVRRGRRHHRTSHLSEWPPASSIVLVRFEAVGFVADEFSAACDCRPEMTLGIDQRRAVRHKPPQTLGRGELALYSEPAGREVIVHTRKIVRLNTVGAVESAIVRTEAGAVKTPNFRSRERSQNSMTRQGWKTEFPIDSAKARRRACRQTEPSTGVGLPVIEIGSSLRDEPAGNRRRVSRSEVEEIKAVAQPADRSTVLTERERADRFWRLPFLDGVG